MALHLRLAHLSLVSITPHPDVCKVPSSLLLAHSSAQECAVTFPYVKTLFSPPFYSSACCLLPFMAKPPDRVVYSLQFLNVHQSLAVSFPLLPAIQELFDCHPSLSSTFLSFLLEQQSLSFLGCPIQLSAGSLLAGHSPPSVPSPLCCLLFLCSLTSLVNA